MDTKSTASRTPEILKRRLAYSVPTALEPPSALQAEARRRNDTASFAFALWLIAAAERFLSDPLLNLKVRLAPLALVLVDRHG